MIEPINVAISISGILAVFFFIESFAGKKSKYPLLARVFTLIGAVVIDLFLRPMVEAYIFLVFIYINIFILSYFLFFYRVAWYRAMLGTAIFFLLEAVTEVVAVFLVLFFHNSNLVDYVGNQVYVAQAMVLKYFFYLSIIAIIRIVNKKSTKHLKSSTAVFLTVLIYTFNLITIHVFTADFIYYEITGIETLLMFAGISLFLMITSELFIRYEDQKRARQLIESQNQMQAKHIKELMDVQMAVMKLSHDFKHQVSSLYAMGEAEGFERLMSELKQMANTTVQSNLVLSDNPTLDMLLSQKKQEAERLRISYHSDFKIHPHLNYISMDICVLLNNAFANAFEAAAKCTDESRWLSVMLHADQRSLKMTMKNSFLKAPIAKQGTLMTLKEKHFLHGIGLRSMEETVRKCEGKMKYQYQNMVFELHIFIPAPTL